MKAFIVEVVTSLTFVAIIFAGVFAMKYLFELLDFILYGC